MEKEKKTPLQKRSRKVYILGALPLYLLVCITFYGSGVFYIFVWPVITVLFLLLSVVLYIPARIYIERYISSEKGKISKYTALLPILIPYFIVFAFFLYVHIDWTIQYSKPYNVWRAEQDLKPYSEKFVQHTQWIMHVQDIFANWNTQNSDKKINMIRYSLNEAIYEVFVTDDDGHYQHFLLDELENMTDKEKAEVRALFETLRKNNQEMQLTVDSVGYYYNAGVSVYFTRENADMTGLGSPEKYIPIDDHWVMEIYVSPYPPSP